MIVAAKDLRRMQRLRDQAAAGGTPLPAATLAAIREAEEREALTGAADDGAGEVRTPVPADIEDATVLADVKHVAGRADCGCIECSGGERPITFRRGYGYGADTLLQRADGSVVRTKSAIAPGADLMDYELVEDEAPPPVRRAPTSTKFKPPAWLRGLVAEIRAWTLETFARASVVADLERKLAELETKCAELENRSGATATASALADAYVGVHVDGKHYERGQLCTHGGSLWLCVRTNDGARPGRTDDWKLVVKHGKDAAREPR